MACFAESMANTANHYHQDIAITVGERACLSTEHLKIPPQLSHKLAVCFV